MGGRIVPKTRGYPGIFVDGKWTGAYLNKPTKRQTATDPLMRGSIRSRPETDEELTEMESRNAHFRRDLRRKHNRVHIFTGLLCSPFAGYKREWLVGARKVRRVRHYKLINVPEME